MVFPFPLHVSYVREYWRVRACLCAYVRAWASVIEAPSPVCSRELKQQIRFSVQWLNRILASDFCCFVYSFVCCPSLDGPSFPMVGIDWDVMQVYSCVITCLNFKGRLIRTMYTTRQETLVNITNEPKVQPINHATNQSYNKPIMQQTNHPTNQSLEQPINHAMEQPTNQPTDQLTNHANNQ